MTLTFDAAISAASIVPLKVAYTETKGAILYLIISTTV